MVSLKIKTALKNKNKSFKKKIGRQSNIESITVPVPSATQSNTSLKKEIERESNIGSNNFLVSSVPQRNESIISHDGTNSITKSVSNGSYGTIDHSSPQMKEPTLIRTQEGFFEDLKNMTVGTVPQSIVIAIVIGIICGVSAWLYYICLFGALEYIWHTLPKQLVVGVWYEWAYALWIPLVGLTMAVCLGLTVKYLGEPGDLPFTIKAVHTKAYLGMDHIIPMVCASQFSILGGGSLGPEAPLVAICASLGGFVSRTIFKQTNRNVIRKHTLMGMAGALAAFFGAPLGGSLFALEVNSRFGLEYYEHVLESIFCGEITLVVFRACARLPISPIWTIVPTKLTETTPQYVAVGGALGLFGAGMAALFAKFHFKVVDMFKHFNLMNDKDAIWRALLGASVLLPIGMLLPQTLFWGEYEFQQISTLSPADELEHVWPTRGLFGFEMDTCFKCFVVGVAKLIAISFTVAGGYRGGFIFPFFSAGAAFGRFFVFLFPGLPASYACLCIAAGINVAITRTALGTTVILTFLSGEQNTMSAVLAASLVSLFVTSYMPFIKTQTTRSDLGESLFFEKEDLVVKKKEENKEDAEKISLLV